MHHQHWHQSSNVEGEACIDGKEGDEEGVSGGQEEADRCRDAGRTAVVHRTQVIAQMQEAEKIAAALRLKYICKLIHSVLCENASKVYGIRCYSTATAQLIRT